MNKSQMLAHYIREDEADCHSRDVIYERSADSAHYVGMLLDVADFLDRLSEDDPRIVQMDRAHYFATDVCVPGPNGQAYVCHRVPLKTDPESFLDSLAAAASADEQLWNAGEVPADARSYGWWGTTFVHTVEFGAPFMGAFEV